MIRVSSLRLGATAGVALTTGLVLVGGQSAAALITSVFPYAVGTPDSEYETAALLSVGDRVPETSNPAKQNVPVGPGIWETSGTIDASRLFGAGSWLFDVQAHPPTTAPVANTVEDGQLLLLKPIRR